MGVPTDTEIEMALEAAARMREQGQDPEHLAKVLLNHHYQLGLLEKVLQAATLYLHSGEGAREHSKLVHAIDAAKNAKQNKASPSERAFTAEMWH
jgi:hypothetical protein